MLRHADKTDAPVAAPVEFGIIRHELDGRTSLISVEGELDLSSAPQLKWTLRDSLDAGHDQIVLDLSLSTFMDSTALGVLIGVNRSLDVGGRMAIACARTDVLHIFELSGLDSAFAIFATLGEALAYIQREPVGQRGTAKVR
ncbi:MAG: STAS domain-containing protein [Solirubrobacteraceae bacterium]|jgi:anti-sigma B factor antagonist